MLSSGEWEGQQGIISLGKFLTLSGVGKLKLNNQRNHLTQMIDELNDVVLMTKTKEGILKQSENNLQDQKLYLSHACFPNFVIVDK